MGSGSPDTSSWRLAQKPPTEPEMQNLGKGGARPKARGTGTPEASGAVRRDMAGEQGHRSAGCSAQDLGLSWNITYFLCLVLP